MRAGLYICPVYAHEWNPGEQELKNSIVVLDANGTILQNGDSVIVLKNLPVKEAPSSIKAGTKVKNIRLT